MQKKRILLEDVDKRLMLVLFGVLCTLVLFFYKQRELNQPVYVVFQAAAMMIVPLILGLWYFWCFPIRDKNNLIEAPTNLKRFLSALSFGVAYVVVVISIDVTSTGNVYESFLPFMYVSCVAVGAYVNFRRKSILLTGALVGIVFGLLKCMAF